MKNNLKSWFTLIELIVSISILSLIMVSIFTIFSLATDANNKTDISRSMQENIKNIVENISEDVRVNGLTGLSNDILSTCSLDETYYQTWTKLCFSNTTSYYLWYLSDSTNTYKRVTDFSECDIWKKSCVLLKSVSWEDPEPISNSWVEFRDIKFSILNSKDNKEKKLVLNFVIQPSIKKWVKIDLVKENKIVFQTTFSQRLYNSN